MTEDTMLDCFVAAFVSHATPADLVDVADRCPACGERRIDWLVWPDDDGEAIQCATCQKIYTPGVPGKGTPEMMDTVWTDVLGNYVSAQEAHNCYVREANGRTLAAWIRDTAAELWPDLLDQSELDILADAAARDLLQDLEEV